MPRDCVKTDAGPKSAFYSQAVKAAGLIFVSGQQAVDPATGQLVGTNIKEQTHQCLENVSAILSAADSSLEKVVSATFILRDPEDFAGMNEESGSRGSPSTHQLGRARSYPFDVPGMRVSISVIAEA